jgi:hypothetical protein
MNMNTNILPESDSSEPDKRSNVPLLICHDSPLLNKLIVEGNPLFDSHFD